MAPFSVVYGGRPSLAENGSGPVLCVAPLPEDRAELVELVQRAGRDVDTAATPEEALARLAEHTHPFCLLLLDGAPASLRVARAIRAQHQATAIIGILDAAAAGQLPEALRVGVFDVALRPVTPRELDALLSNAREQGELRSHDGGRAVDLAPFGVFGASPAMRGVTDLIRLAAPKRCGVFICGEPGAGHEMVARAIHAQGGRARAPFVTVDCGAATAPELEQALFGGGRRRGRRAVAGEPVDRLSPASALGQAIGGTLFLEHVPRTPEGVQLRLVRILRQGHALVGGDRAPTPLDIRPIASADLLLPALDDAPVLPELYERLSLVRIEIPPLRERREDIPALAVHFLKDVCRAHGQPPKTLTRPALTLLAALPWRGNVRELRMLLERLVILVPQGIIRLEDVLGQTRMETSVVPAGAAATLREARARFEREYVAAIVQQHRGRMTAAAQVLGIQRTNLYRKMRRLNLVAPRAPSRPR